MNDVALPPISPALAIEKNNRSLLKVVMAAILVSLLWKLTFLIQLDRIQQAMPLQDPFFPAVFRSQTVARTTYLIATSLSALLLFSKSRSILTIGSMLLVVALFSLNIHQASFNDVTFLCCGWSAAWCWWFSTRLDEPTESLHPRAAWLAHAIVSLVFIGGAVGKLTPEYWSGQVLYEVYFIDRDFWFYNIIRSYSTADGLRNAATMHSRMVIATELACGFLWLLPMRIASLVALIVLLGIAMTNNFLLFSVITSLMGLSIIGLHQPKNIAHQHHDLA